MTEPLTDAEFEGLKEHYKDDEKVADIHALIATVEGLKIGQNELRLEIDWKSTVIKGWMEENAKLKEELEESKLRHDETNNNLEETDVIAHALHKENAKLKTQLEAALKRIEEME